MSYFLCGSFVFKTHLSLTERTNFAYKVVEEVCAIRLSIQLSICIVQQIVFEIIGTNSLSELETKMPFLLTDSPISDVSDELIDLDDIDGGVEKLKRTLEQLQSFLARIKKTAVVSDVIIYFSEGYDNKYENITSSLDTFTKDCLGVFARSGDVGSLCLKVSLL
jgi:hypothetical protein